MVTTIPAQAGVKERLDAVDAKFTELLEWYKAVNFGAVRAVLEIALPDTAKRVVYELSLASRTSEEVAKLAQQVGTDKVSGRTVRTWQAEWLRLGLMRPVTARKRERIFKLPDFGIEVGADLSKLNGTGKGNEEGE